jgi:hypothetical protein
MADFFKGLAGGFGTGLQLGQQLRQRRMEDELAKVYAAPTSDIGYTPADMAEMRRQQETGAYDIEGIPGAEGQPPTLRYTPKQGLELGQGEMPAAPTNFAPQQVQRYGGRTTAGQFSPEQLQGLQMREAARIMGAYGDPARAAQLQAEAMRMEREAEERPLRQRALKTQVEVGESQLRGLGRAEEKEIGFNTAFDKINSTKYETPAEKDAAVLAAVSQFKGPEAAAQLQANYSTNERNTILTQGAKFDQTIKQARLKGPAAALKAIDDLNDSFKLEIDGFKVTQVNNDGTRVPFLQAKNAEEFALSVDSRIKEGGAFELAKFRQDEQTKNAQIGYYNAMAKKAASEGGSAANQLSGVQVGYARDEKGNPIQVMSALRFNKRSGELESVQVPLERNVVPASALDPEKITKAAELIVGTPVDPTNKKGPQHTFQTARQAVTDQIFNQYLGTGGAAADLDPKGLAAKILAGQQPSTATPAQRPARPPAAVGIDPNRPQAAINPVTGLPRETPVGAPNLVAAVGQGLDAGQARYKAYLESKIANRQPLTADEQIRAQRLGL